MCDAHSQLGSNIDNYQSDELHLLDFSLSDDGMTVAIVPHTSTGNLTLKVPPYDGQARVFKFNTEKSQWEQKGGIVTLSGALYDHNNYYTRVTLSGDGNVLAIADSLRKDMEVFGFDGNDWIQLGQNITLLGFLSSFNDKIVLSKDGRTLVYTSTILDLGNFYYKRSFRAFRYDVISNEWKKKGGDLVLGHTEEDHMISVSGDGNAFAAWQGQSSISDDDIGTFTVYSYNVVTDKWGEKGNSVQVCGKKFDPAYCLLDDRAILTNDGETFIWNERREVDDENGDNRAIISHIYKYNSASNEWIKDSDATIWSYKYYEDFQYFGMENEFSNDGTILAITGEDQSYEQEGVHRITKYSKKVRIFSYDKSDGKWTKLEAEFSMKDFEPAYPTFSLSGDGNHIAFFINENADFSSTPTLEPTYLKVFELCKTPSAAYLLPMKFATIGITLVMSTLLFV